MYIASLICSPMNPVLNPDIVSDLAGELGATDITWLADVEAAELRLAQMPPAVDALYDRYQAMSIDFNILPDEGRRKRVLLADMDSTMINQECIDELAKMAGVGEEVVAITKQAMRGELDFDGALLARVGLLRGHSTDLIKQVIQKRLNFAPGARTLMRTMRAQNVYAALVSGGFTDFTGYVAQELGFDEHRANRLGFARDAFTGDVVPPILGREAKRVALDEITARLGLSAQDVIAVGDGANDLAMLRVAGMGVALHAKPSVAQVAKLRINHGDLTALLFLQGYAKNTFFV